MSLSYEDYATQSSFLEDGPQPATEPESKESRFAEIAGIGVAIAASVIVLRKLMSDRLSQEEPPKDVESIVHKAWKFVAPLWLRMTVPLVTQAYRLGATATMTANELAWAAEDYAKSMGDYLTETSGQALMEGFHAQVNAGWSPELAWKRATFAYGMDSGQMRAWMASMLKLDRTKFETDAIPAAQRATAEKYFMMRATRYGDNEAYAASEMGKAVSWLLSETRGDLVDAKKIWRTAEDERVCSICGPLDGVAIGLAHRFHSGGRAFFAPGVHPNCRCWLELSQETYVEKAAPGDPYDRDSHGRFSTREQRRSPSFWADRFAFQEEAPKVEKPVFRVGSDTFKGPGFKVDTNRFKIGQFRVEEEAGTQANKPEKFKADSGVGNPLQQQTPLPQYPRNFLIPPQVVFDHAEIGKRQSIFEVGALYVFRSDNKSGHAVAMKRSDNILDSIDMLFDEFGSSFILNFPPEYWENREDLSVFDGDRPSDTSPTATPTPDPEHYYYPEDIDATASSVSPNSVLFVVDELNAQSVRLQTDSNHKWDPINGYYDKPLIGAYKVTYQEIFQTPSLEDAGVDTMMLVHLAPAPGSHLASMVGGL